MIVGTRLVSGKIAHFDINTDDYKVARNEVMWELGAECGIHTPLLVSIPNCGRDIKPSIAMHLVKATTKDPLKGAVERLSQPETTQPSPGVFIARAEPVPGSKMADEDLPENRP